jgi:hypothetical protein
MARTPWLGNGRNVAVAVSLGQELLDIALLTFAQYCALDAAHDSRPCPNASLELHRDKLIRDHNLTGQGDGASR